MRPMVEADIDFALRLTDEEGWGYTRPEFERILRLPHLGSFVLEEEGPVGFVTSVQFGKSAVVGHLVVVDSSRGRCLGRMLLDASLRELDRAGAESVVVFSTPSAERLYESCGFKYMRDVVSYAFEVKEWTPSPPCPRLLATDMACVCAMDEELFGDDRSVLLEDLFVEYPDLCFKTVRGGRMTGYVFGRRTSLGGDIGPWACTTGSARDAQGLVESVQSVLGRVRVDLGFFDDVPLARSAMDGREAIKSIPVGFMVRGAGRYPKEQAGALGIVGFELG